MAAPKKALFNLVITRREKIPGRKNSFVIGGGWLQPLADGSQGISLSLNPGVVIDWRLCEEFYLGVLPKEEKDGQAP